MRILLSILVLFTILNCSSESTVTTASENIPSAEQQLPAPHPDDTFSVPLTYIMGQFDPSIHPEFSMIDQKYANRSGMYIRTDVYQDFQRMWEAAQADGIQLIIVSATRNFTAQKRIWEAKWSGKRKIEGGKDATIAFPDPATRARMILKFSSMPGSSRHHWGTDIDLNSLDNAYFTNGTGKKIYDWLKANASEYGFCQPYTEKGPKRPNGYNEERWHWSYMPISRPLTAQAQKELKDEMINGFLGAETAGMIGIVNNYVLGINDLCRNR